MNKIAIRMFCIIDLTEKEYKMYNPYYDAWHLANRYKKMLVANKTIYLQRCDWVLETFNDINQLWKKDYNAFIEELSKIYTV